ncbi:MAG: CRISPR-associated protein Csx15 [Anaerolineae bacterium]
MILLNFAHPITDEQLRQLEALLGQPVTRVVDVPAHFDTGGPFVEQTVALVDRAAQLAGLTPETWQTVPLLVNPPSLNFITAALLAELHGRAGYFPPILRTRPLPDAIPPRFEVAEVINLQRLREAARGRR